MYISKSSCLVLLLCVGAIYCASLPVNVQPMYNICANGGDSQTCSNHGKCVNDACVCTDGYSGRDCSTPPGGFPYAIPAGGRATKFANLDGSDGQLVSTTCFGADSPVTRDNLPAGVDGIVAVNPTLYGSRYAFGGVNQYTSKTITGQYAGVGQSCGQCFKLTKGSKSQVVMVVNRCGGFCQSNSVSQCALNGTTSTDCGYCIQPGREMATNIDCSCLSPQAKNPANFGYCDAVGQAHHCDHCAANDHAHFDLDTDSFNALCGAENIGVCDLDTFQWVECGGIQYSAGHYPNGQTPYSAPLNIAGGSTSTTKPSTSASSTTAPTVAPTKPATVAPTVKPTQPATVPPVTPTKPASTGSNQNSNVPSTGANTNVPSGAHPCDSQTTGNWCYDGGFVSCPFTGTRACQAGLVCQQQSAGVVYCVTPSQQTTTPPVNTVAPTVKPTVAPTVKPTLPPVVPTSPPVLCQ